MQASVATECFDPDCAVDGSVPTRVSAPPSSPTLSPSAFVYSINNAASRRAVVQDDRQTPELTVQGNSLDNEVEEASGYNMGGLWVGSVWLDDSTDHPDARVQPPGFRTCRGDAPRKDVPVKACTEIARGVEKQHTAACPQSLERTPLESTPLELAKQFLPDDHDMYYYKGAWVTFAQHTEFLATLPQPAPLGPIAQSLANMAMRAAAPRGPRRKLGKQRALQLK